MTKKDKKCFNEVLLESIDEALTAIGETVKLSIYFHLEKEFAIKRKDIPRQIDAFSDALERIFGLGAKQLEILIMRKLHERVTCHYKWEGPKWLVPDLTFEKYVKLMSICFEGESKIGDVEVFVDAGELEEQRI